MKNGVKVALRMSEVRQRLNEIAGLSDGDLTDEVRSEADKLGTEYSDLEVRNRAALVGESTETVTEGRAGRSRAGRTGGPVGAVRRGGRGPVGPGHGRRNGRASE